MYKILWSNKFISLSGYILISVLIAIMTENIFTDIFLVIVGIRIYLYLSGLKVYIKNNSLIKETGKVFNRKHYIMLKNIRSFQVIIFHTMLPTLIRIHCVDRTIIIFGLSVHQSAEIERAILNII